MQSIDLDRETYPYINLWLQQQNEVDIFWDEETKSLVRIYVDEDILWQSSSEIHGLDKALEALNEFLGDTIFSEAEDFTEDWKHGD